ncbi:hypothetical protein BZA05DRAFT_409656 [Tricharina praecox]|uniref:uncharacterized protein n=1 Tax=Tricharina praecox TaxID=43433 RepID=UPI00221F4389|nr:uncharacterized protein BZA05DRAFT_409656 [Tricharina praecox]KAI5844283.1 hypothetical protein BZA05DRAFT_409656 [Tricharina praecox]
MNHDMTTKWGSSVFFFLSFFRSFIWACFGFSFCFLFFLFGLASGLLCFRGFLFFGVLRSRSWVLGFVSDCFSTLC